MFKWLHHIFNPHCEHCKEESEDNRICKSCETLKQQLEIANYEKKMLMESWIRETSKSSQANNPVAEVNYDQVRPKLATWNIRRQMLEAEDREKAKLLKQQASSVDIDRTIKLTNDIEKLEEELGVAEQKMERQ